MLAIALAACAAPPAGPLVPVAPGPRKSFDEFALDQAACERYASAQTAPSASMASAAGIGTALIGTALGAGIGAAVAAGHGAAVGAVSGAALGGAAGAAEVGFARSSLQQQYDALYARCMLAKGNRAPGFGHGPGGPPPYS